MKFKIKIFQKNILLAAFLMLPNFAKAEVVFETNFDSMATRITNFADVIGNGWCNINNYNGLEKLDTKYAKMRGKN